MIKAPGVEANREVVGEKLVTGKIKIDDAADVVLGKQHVVREQVSVDNTFGQIARPLRFEKFKFFVDEVRKSRFAFVRAVPTVVGQPAPSSEGKRVLPFCLKIWNRMMEISEYGAGGRTMGCAGRHGRLTRKKRNDYRRAIGERTDDRVGFFLNRRRGRHTFGRKMRH